MWKIAILFLFPFVTLPALPDDAPAKLDNYFPLTPGIVWKYGVSVKIDDAAPKVSEQTVKIESQQIEGKPLIVASENAYAAREDGVYIIGVLNNAKLEPLDEPQKVVPANPRLGDKWNYREISGVTSATCLGTEKVKVGAGEYDAAKIYLITVGGTDGADRREVYRWFAPGVGPVKGLVTQRKRNPDGSLASIEIAMELTSLQLPNEKTGAAAAVAQANTTESLFAQGEDAARKGDHQTALARYDAALAIDPKAAKVHAYKTLSLIATRQFDAAQSEINRALALDQKDYTYQEIAGQLKIAQGRIAEGKSLYDKAATLSPGSAGAIYTDLAAALAARKDDRLAPDIDKALKTAANANPPSPEALFALGQSYVNAGRGEAKTYLQKYIEVASKLPDGKRDDQKIRLAKQLIRAIDAVKGNP
jgi:tetratricopeptide (TPR) repeat protein